MSGKDLRLKKLFGTKKNLVISALDHVMEYGDKPGIEDAREAITNCLGTDALLLPRFMLKRNWDLFAGENAPVPIDRKNYNSRFASIRKKTVKSPRFAPEIFTNAFPPEKRQLCYKYATRNRTFCQE